jgi:hypothetical protein
MGHGSEVMRLQRYGGDRRYRRMQGEEIEAIGRHLQGKERRRHLLAHSPMFEGLTL